MLAAREKNSAGAQRMAAQCMNQRDGTGEIQAAGKVVRTSRSAPKAILCAALRNAISLRTVLSASSCVHSVRETYDPTTTPRTEDCADHSDHSSVIPPQ